MDNTELLALLNQFTRREHTLDEVYLFDLVLCDNEIDRDGDCFSDEALEKLAALSVGVTGIFDHNLRAGNQAARIFRTEVCSDPVRKTAYGKPYRFLRANAYMVRTDGNADLIREIDGGIKKEVSVSCAVSRRICSVCGTNRIEKPCRHLPRRKYGETQCFFLLDGVNDVYEWSFVAVPAQQHAGVTKTCGALCRDTEKEQMRVALGECSDLLERLTDSLRKDVVRLCFKDGDSVCAKLLADSAASMDTEHLMLLRDRLAQTGCAKTVPPQLSADSLGCFALGKGDIL